MGGFLIKPFGKRAVPLIRYTCLVGSFLLGLLFLLGDPDKPASSPTPDRWTSLDSLRAMAHLGEPVQAHAGNARSVGVEQAVSEPARRNQLTDIADWEKPLIMNAQARMDTPKTIKPSMATKPRKQKVAGRQARVRTAVAENASRISPDFFRPPSW
jgi:hypothetical protein